MARQRKETETTTGLYYARRASGLTIEQLAKKARTSRQTVMRLESGDRPPKGMKLTADWAKRFAPHVKFSAEQILFWRHEYAKPEHIESADVLETNGAGVDLPHAGAIRELDLRAGMGGGGVPSREVRRDGQHADPVKAEAWQLPSSFLREIGAMAGHLLVLDTAGDSMYPTIASGERLIADTRHKQPSPDGIYAIRDTFGAIVAKRLQVMRTRPPRVKIISDNPNHAAEEVGLDDIEIVGKVIVGIKRF